MRSTTLAILISIAPLLIGTVVQAQDAGEGAIVVRDTSRSGPAPIYAHAEGQDIESQASQDQLVAGITTPQTHGLLPRLSALGVLSHTYVFESSHGRVHVVYFPAAKQSGTVKTAWMDPADLQTFTYDCSCGLKEFRGLAEPCSPFTPIGIPRFKWNGCFLQARDKQLTASGRSAAPAVAENSGSTASEAPASAPEDDADKPLSADAIAKLTGGGTPDDQPANKAGGSGGSGKQSKSLTNEEIIKLVKAELGDKVVIDKINSSPGDKLDTSTDALIRLKKAGVSKAIIDAMIKRGDRE